MPYSNDNELMTALSDGLDRQIAAMETLRACLEEEHRALQIRDPEQLLSVTERKTACLNDAGQISQLCQELEARIAEQMPTASSQAVSRRNEQLDTLMRMCRELNNVNGSLIRRQKMRVDKTLQIMRGEPERTDLYGPSGATTGRNSAHRLLASI
jgi:flagellar biosynthesis/type III secretory pathway chaperone